MKIITAKIISGIISVVLIAFMGVLNRWRKSGKLTKWVATPLVILSLLGGSIFGYLAIFKEGISFAAWSYEELFNSDTKSLGDLNGQDGWTGDTEFDVVSSTGLDLEGDQSVSVLADPSSSYFIVNSFTATSSGIVYMKVRSTVANENAPYFRLTESSNLRVIFRFKSSGYCGLYDSGSSSYRDSFAYSANTSYWIAIEFDAATNEARLNFSTNGTTWDGWTDWYEVFSSFDNIDGISLGCPNYDTNVFTAYYDSITGTDPLAAPPAAAPVQSEYWWDD